MISSNKLSLWPIFRRASYKLFPSLIPKRFFSLNRPKNTKKKSETPWPIICALLFVQVVHL